MSQPTVDEFRAARSVNDLLSEWTAKELLAFSDSDDSNTTAIPSWGSAATYDGSFTRVAERGSLFAFVLSYQPFDTTPNQPRIEWSDDGVTAATFLGSPITTTIPISTIVQGVDTFYVGLAVVNAPFIRAKYYRLRAKNGATLSSFFYAISGVGRYAAVGSVAPITDPLNQLSVAQLVRSVQAGNNPNGDFTNGRIGGAVTNDPATAILGTSGVYTSIWYPSEGFVSVALGVMTDQVSGTNGIKFEFSDDQSTVRRTVLRTYTAADVVAGSKFITMPNQGDYVRVTYTNGGVAQTTFFLQLRLNVTALDASRDSLESDLNSTNVAQMVRDIIAAKNDSGVYGNILRGNDGGLRIALNEQEVEIQQKACSSETRFGTSVGTTASQLDVTKQTNRKYITICNNDGTKTVYYGTTSTNLVTDGIALPAGSSHQQEWDETLDVWARSASGTCDTRLSQTGGVLA